MRNRKISWKWIPMTFLLIFTTSFILVESAGIIDYNDLAYWAEASGLAAGFIIFILLLSDVITPVPSSILMLFAGSIYGFALGLAIGFAGSIGASLIGFYIMRKLREPVGEKIIGALELKKMNAWFKRWGEAGIIISRMAPMASEIMSFLAGLSGMRLKNFFILSVFGTLPISAYYAYAGSVAKNSIEWAVYLTAGFVIPVAAWIIFKRFSYET